MAALLLLAPLLAPNLTTPRLAARTCIFRRLFCGCVGKIPFRVCPACIVSKRDEKTEKDVPEP